MTEQKCVIHVLGHDNNGMEFSKWFEDKSAANDHMADLENVWRSQISWRLSYYIVEPSTPLADVLNHNLEQVPETQEFSS